MSSCSEPLPCRGSLTLLCRSSFCRKEALSHGVARAVAARRRVSPCSGSGPGSRRASRNRPDRHGPRRAGALSRRGPPQQRVPPRYAEHGTCCSRQPPCSLCSPTFWYMGYMWMCGERHMRRERFGTSPRRRATDAPVRAWSPQRPASHHALLSAGKGIFVCAGGLVPRASALFDRVVALRRAREVVGTVIPPAARSCPVQCERAYLSRIVQQPHMRLD